MRIVRAALMYPDGEVFEGFDYTTIGNLARKLGYSGEHIRGFLDSSDGFILPKEAAQVAWESGQTLKALDELSPDDLWPRVD